jgi:hypothetical protein
MNKLGRELIFESFDEYSYLDVEFCIYQSSPQPGVAEAWPS